MEDIPTFNAVMSSIPTNRFYFRFGLKLNKLCILTVLNWYKTDTTQEEERLLKVIFNLHLFNVQYNLYGVWLTVREIKRIEMIYLTT